MQLECPFVENRDFWGTASEAYVRPNDALTSSERGETQEPSHSPGGPVLGDGPVQRFLSGLSGTV